MTWRKAGDVARDALGNYEQWIGWNRKKAQDYIDEVSSIHCMPGPCVHGHFDCATHPNGPCSNEVAVFFELPPYGPEEADGEDD